MSDAFAGDDVGWDSDPMLCAWSGLPCLEGHEGADACVVGLGGSGLAAVGALLEQGMSVVGLDAGRVAGGAAGRNGGFLLAGPKSLIACKEEVGEACAIELYRRTLDELQRLIELLGPDVIRRVGSLRIAGMPGQPRNEDEVLQRTAELAVLGAEAEILGNAGIRVEPYAEELGEGLYFPDNAAMNPVSRAFGLAERYRRSSRLFEHSPVLSIEPGRVKTPKGSVSAPVIIIAVDGRLDALCPALAPAVRTVRLQMLATGTGLPCVLPFPTLFRAGWDYAQQDHNGRILIGGGRDKFPLDEQADEALPTSGVQAWIAQVAQRLVGQPVSAQHQWAGLVGYTQDTRPLCVAVEDGVVACGGYNGHGNLIGPVAARAAVEVAIHGTTPPAYLRSSVGRPA